MRRAGLSDARGHHQRGVVRTRIVAFERTCRFRMHKLGAASVGRDAGMKPPTGSAGLSANLRIRGIACAFDPCTA
jgi:hypothetical protein